MECPPRAWTTVHSLRRVVLPKPAGAERRVRRRPGSRIRLSVRRGLATSFGRAWEGCSLVDKSGSNARATSPSDYRLYRLLSTDYCLQITVYRLLSTDYCLQITTVITTVAFIKSADYTKEHPECPATAWV